MTIFDRYVVLVLASPRAGWFRLLAQWSHSSSLPVDLIKCVSVEELRSRLTSGHAFSAVLADSTLRSVDRDLIDLAHRAQCPLVIVEDPRRSTNWTSLGAATTLSCEFDRKELLEALRRHAVTVSCGATVPGTTSVATLGSPVVGQVVAVCGSGGTGTSTLSIALAQGMAARSNRVLLADLARNAEQAMLHDARDVVPGLPELVEAHRSANLEASEVPSFTFDVVERGYNLLLGLRRASAWASLRPRSFVAAFETIASTYDVLVCDTDSDIEGETDGGSLDVEERNVMSRTAIAQSDAVVVVGIGGMKGLHSMGRLINDLSSYGVQPSAIVPVINRTPRHPRQKAEVTRTLARLVPEGGSLNSPVFVPERRLDECLRDGLALPATLVDPLTEAVSACLADNEAQAVGPPESPRETLSVFPPSPASPQLSPAPLLAREGSFVRVQPGTLGIAMPPGARSGLDESGGKGR